jgi:hypothetical protein
MTTPREYLDPTSERTPVARARAARPASLAGKTIALIDIGKPRGDVFLDQLETRLQAEGLTTVRFRKPTFTKPAPLDLRQEIASRCDAVIQALAD